MPFKNVLRDESSLWTEDRLAEQRAAHDGEALARWAALVLRQLPAGPISLLSLSVEGCALAAVVAASRAEPTTWEHCTLQRPPVKNKGAKVVVEAVRLGKGVREELENYLPDAPILDGFASTQGLSAAA